MIFLVDSFFSFYSLGSGAVQVGKSRLIKTTTQKTIATGSAGINEKPSKEPPPTKSTKDCNFPNSFFLIIKSYN